MANAKLELGISFPWHAWRCCATPFWCKAERFMIKRPRRQTWRRRPAWVHSLTLTSFLRKVSLKRNQPATLAANRSAGVSEESIYDYSSTQIAHSIRSTSLVQGLSVLLFPLRRGATSTQTNSPGSIQATCCWVNISVIIFWRHTCVFICVPITWTWWHIPKPFYGFLALRVVI